MSAMILKVKKKKNAQIRPELMSSLKLINIFDALKCFTSKRKEYICMYSERMESRNSYSNTKLK